MCCDACYSLCFFKCCLGYTDVSVECPNYLHSSVSPSSRLAYLSRAWMHLLDSFHTLFLLESFRIDTDKACGPIIFQWLEVLYLLSNLSRNVRGLRWFKFVRCSCSSKIECFIFHLATSEGQNAHLHRSTVRGSKVEYKPKIVQLEDDKQLMLLAVLHAHACCLCGFALIHW